MGKFVDLTGQRFGKLVVVERGENNKNNNAMWKCKCDCGYEKTIACGSDLRANKIKSCGRTGCKIKKPRRNSIGQKFGRLTVIKYVNPDNFGRTQYSCLCECGNVHIASDNALNNGQVKSCGKCNFGNLNSRFRGCGHVPRTYFSQVQRNALLRSIKFDISIEYLSIIYEKQNSVCSLTSRSLEFGHKKKETTASLDRIDSSKGYIKGNVRWVHKDVNIHKLDMPDIEYAKHILSLQKWAKETVAMEKAA